MNVLDFISATQTIGKFLSEQCEDEQTEHGPFCTISQEDVTVCNNAGNIVYDSLDPDGVLKWKI